MIWWSSVERHKERLLVGAEAAVSAAVQAAWRRTKSPSEPAFISALVTNGTPTLGAIWSPILASAGIQCKISSVFVHQSPKVDLSTSGNCELGDLLLVHEHRTWDDRVFTRALLLQAKVHQAQSARLTLSSRIQAELYDSWPLFTYATPAYLRTECRNSYPKHPHPGAQYLIIKPANRRRLDGGMYVAPASLTITIAETRTLASVLVDLLLGRDGRVVSRPRGSSISWSQIVHDLLFVGSQRYFNCAKAQAKDQPALSSVGTPLIQDHIAFYSLGSEESNPLAFRLALLGSSNDHINNTGGDLQQNDRDGAGVSTILISTDSTFENDDNEDPS